MLDVIISTPDALLGEGYGVRAQILLIDLQSADDLAHFFARGDLTVDIFYR